MSCRRVLLCLLAAMLVLPAVKSNALTLDEASCGILSSTSLFNPGFDRQAESIAFLLDLLPVEDLPISTDWYTWDLEKIEGSDVTGDGILDNFQIALLAAVLCSEESSPRLDLIRQQYDVNLVMVEETIEDIDYLADNAERILDLIAGNPHANPPVIGIAPGLAAIPEIAGIVINFPEDGDTIADAAQVVIETVEEIRPYLSLLPLVTTTLEQVAPLLAGMGGLNSEMKAWVDELAGPLAEAMGSMDEVVGIVNVALLLYGSVMPAELKAEIRELLQIVVQWEPSLPDFLIYGVVGKAENEPISAFGDWNADGLPNLLTFEDVMAAGGDREDFVAAVTQASFRVTSPNGGERWEVDSFQTITWEPAVEQVGDYVRVGLHQAGGIFVDWLALRAPNTGAFDWLVPVDLPQAGDYLVRVQSYTDNGVRDFSDEPFAIVDDAPIRVTSPQRRDEWVTDTIVNITWTSNEAVAGPFVRVGLHRGMDFYGWLALKAANSGSFSWIVPADLEPASNYRVRVQSYVHNDVRSFSRRFDVIRAPLALTAPARGDVWPLGSVQRVTWVTDYAVAGPFVRLALHGQGEFLGWIVRRTENDGMYEMPIAPSLTPGPGYKIRVQSYEDNETRDFSQRFSIGGP